DLDRSGRRGADDLRRDPAAPQARTGRLSHRASGRRPPRSPPPFRTHQGIPMRKPAMFCAARALLPLAAPAGDDDCKHSQPRNLQLDMAGVKTVVFEIGANDLDVRAAATPGNAVQGRACASHEDDLSRLVLTQRKSGDRLVVTAERKGKFGGISLFGDRYAYMKLQASVPDDIAVQLEVGSGDASVDGARSARIDTGSGDVRATRI